MTARLSILLLAFVLAVAASAEEAHSGNIYAKWTNGPPAGADFFPIAVWLQAPSNAKKYNEIGINTYVGLWKGPTTEQLDALDAAGMHVICSQNAGLKFKDRKTIVGWMHGDEPDNAQSLKDGKGYGPPIATQKITDDYARLSANDVTRPVLLNLGQGVAYDNYIGRGVRRNKMDDYAEYVKGSDIVSFDIYPVTSEYKEVAGNLWFLPRGVDRLRKWSDDKKIVWNCIECTHISNVDKKATPDQVKAMVWMSLIHGSRGLIYFVHQFKPNFIEAGLLADPEMSAAVGKINKQITDLAPVLNSANVEGLVTAQSSSADAPVDTMVKRTKDRIYIFTVNMRNTPTTTTFSLKSETKFSDVELLHENRGVKIADQKFEDKFSGYEVHLYSIKTP